MADRLVRQQMPSLKGDSKSKYFSEYKGTRNIVLLGDPGAGKTHLFEYFAEKEEGSKYISARNFLNSDIEQLTESHTLYIDALDEKRSGRGDDTAIDEMVRKLGKVKPQQVRISCRAADWLGETDISAFQAYFDGTGGVVVLALEALTEFEIAGLLRTHGVSNPEDFVVEAKRRNLDELLVNPQNLLMLARVVEANNWPTNRKSLYSQATELLLKEHNRTHVRRVSMHCSLDELKHAAGAICAVGLIGDIEGFSLDEGIINGDVPCYLSITLAEREAVLYALTSRIFESRSEPNTLTYTHRTVAEFLAASWVADKVLAGLPIGRLLALIGVDGKPTSELRGLYAWLPTFLPEYANTLIESDPFGVLTYGDASSLTSPQRSYLLNALVRLSESDPWFSGNNWSLPAVAALSAPDMANDFRTILEDDTAEFSLRVLVLEALATGSSVPELDDILLKIFKSDSSPYGERDYAFEALVNLGAFTKGTLLTVAKNLSSSPDNLRLRTEIARRFYGDGMDSQDVITLLRDTFKSKENPISLMFWYLADVIPDSDLEIILDGVTTLQKNEEKEISRDREGVREVIRLIDKLLARLVSADENINGQRLWRWLYWCQEHTDIYTRSSLKDLQQVLTSNPSVLSKVASEAVNSILVDEQDWRFLRVLREATLGTMPDQLLLAEIISTLKNTTCERKKTLYELAICLCFAIGEEAYREYEFLFNYADTDNALQTLRDRCAREEIPEWRVEDSLRQQQEEGKEKASRLKTQEDFEKDRAAIIKGTDDWWTAWVGQVYFGQFTDTDKGAEPYDRLAAIIGEENANAAIEGLLQFVDRNEVTALVDVVAMNTDQKYFPWWIGLIAGLVEWCGRGGDITTLPDDYLRSIIAIDCLHPTYTREIGKEPPEWSWKQKLLSEKPDLAADAYEALARNGFETKMDFPDGLNELLRFDELKPFMSELAKTFVIDYPSMDARSLQDLLHVLSESIVADELLVLVRSGLKTCDEENQEESRRVWLAMGYLLAPEEFGSEIDLLVEDAAKSLVWIFRRLCGAERHRNFTVKTLSPEQLSRIVGFAAKHFDKTKSPRSSVGDQNSWDATNFVQELINKLSADASLAAANELEELFEVESMRDYEKELKHALAKQRTHRLETQFHQASWQEVVEVLYNGEPATVADLHALVLSHIQDVKLHVTSANTNLYKTCWNEEGKRVTSPKIEDSCRDLLVGLLRSRLAPHDVIVEPEGHMVADKRADIVVMHGAKLKVVIELKRDYHSEVWRAMNNQLDRFYTRDPNTDGYGIYGVFWFGSTRPRTIPLPENGVPRPTTAQQMEDILFDLVPPDKKIKIKPFVIDVSPPYQ